MPLYEYQCESCGARLERIQKFSDPPLKECPTCGGTLHKLISSPAFQFKGSGWYITDYARKGDGAKDAKSKDAKDVKDSSSASTDSSSKDSPKESAKETAKSDKPAAPDK
jgi:putative FmdB family regulatory protein